MHGSHIAKTVCVSSGLTLLIVLGLAFIAREPIIDHIVSQVPSEEPIDQQPPQLGNDATIIESIARVNPAVVSVIITKDVPIYERYYETYDPGGIFGGFSIPRVRENGTEEREVGGGSGFIVSNDGMIVTNRHVVEDEEARYTVLLNDGTSYQAEVLARDPQLDIAILQVDDILEGSLPFVRFGDSTSLRLGETVIAIGNALAEFQNSVSVGVVSGLARSITASDGMGRSEQLNQVIQTDAAINPGNSGGPLLNIDGEVIGMNVAASRGADNIGFALPAQEVKSVVDSVREYGRIVRPFLGVRYVMLNERIVEANDLPVTAGALISSGRSADAVAVLPGSPAAVAGLSAGDIILSIDDRSLQEIDLASALRRKEVGGTVTFEVWRDGETQEVDIVLEEAP